jgi:hypothetical protein
MELSIETKQDIYVCLVSTGEAYRELNFNPKLSFETACELEYIKTRELLVIELNKFYASEWLHNRRECHQIIKEVIMDWLASYYQQDLDGYKNLLTKEIAYAIKSNRTIRDEMLKLCDAVIYRLNTLRQYPQLLKADCIPESFYRALIDKINSSYGDEFLNGLRDIPINWLDSSLDYEGLDAEIWEEYKMVKELDY